MLRGKDRRVAVKLWKSVADSIARVSLLKSMIKEGMGLAELEEFNLNLERCYKSKKFQEQAKNREKAKNTVLEEAMKAKLADEQCLLRELNFKKTRMRQEIAEKLTKTQDHTGSLC